MVKVESASRLALELNKAFNLHDIEGLSMLLNDDCVLEDHFPPPDGSIFRGKNEILDHWTGVFEENHDIKVEIEDLSGLGDRCILCWKKCVNDESHTLRGVDIVIARNEKVHIIRSYVKG
jgi:ketosteroid isomerase-like protein